MQAEIVSSWGTVQRDLNWNEMIWFEPRNVCAALRSFAMNQKRPIGGSGAAAPPPSEHGRDLLPENFGSLREMQNEDTKPEAAVFRTLVDQVTLVPDKGGLEIVLRGDLAAILTFAAGKRRLASFGGRAAWRFKIAGIGGCGDTQHPILAIG